MSATTDDTNEVAQFNSSLDYDVTTSPNTDLDSVPDRAVIQFDGEAEPRTSATGDGISLGLGTGYQNDRIMDEMLTDDISVTYLIERAMLDPEATVIPRGA